MIQALETSLTSFCITFCSVHSSLATLVFLLFLEFPERCFCLGPPHCKTVPHRYSHGTVSHLILVSAQISPPQRSFPDSSFQNGTCLHSPSPCTIFPQSTFHHSTCDFFKNWTAALRCLFKKAVGSPVCKSGACCLVTPTMVVIWLSHGRLQKSFEQVSLPPKEILWSPAFKERSWEGA